MRRLLLGAFLASGLVDEIVVARSPRTLAQIAPGAGAGRAAPLLDTLARNPDGSAYELVDTFKRGADTLTVLRRRGLVSGLLA